MKRRGKMQYKTITYKRVKNLGNYQSETVEMTVELSESDNVLEAFEDLKSTLLEALDIQEKVEVPFK